MLVILQLSAIGCYYMAARELYIVLKAINQNNMNEKKHGGARKGSGRKKADYETTTVAFRVKTDYADPIKTAVAEIIKALDNKMPVYIKLKSGETFKVKD